MQILFDMRLLPSEKPYFFHGNDLQSYVYGLLGIFQEFHSGLLSADATVLQVNPTGDISLVVPSCLTHVIIRRDVYRFLSFGLTMIQNSSLPFNREKYPNLDISQDVTIYSFSTTFVHPLFMKKWLSKFADFLESYYSSTSGIKPISVDKDYFYNLFRPKFWQLTCYNDFYFNI